jgi:hypothetical protein
MGVITRPDGWQPIPRPRPPFVAIIEDDAPIDPDLLED